jgi:hypothetical protein
VTARFTISDVTGPILDCCLQSSRNDRLADPLAETWNRIDRPGIPLIPGSPVLQPDGGFDNEGGVGGIAGAMPARRQTNSEKARERIARGTRDGLARKRELARVQPARVIAIACKPSAEFGHFRLPFNRSTQQFH